MLLIPYLTAEALIYYYSRPRLQEVHMHAWTNSYRVRGSAWAYCSGRPGQINTEGLSQS
jgi:hypothetical protein